MSKSQSNHFTWSGTPRLLQQIGAPPATGLFVSISICCKHIISKNTCNDRYTHAPLYIYILYVYIYWLVVSTPLKNISQMGWLFPIYIYIYIPMESHKIHVPNHQPVYINILYLYCVYKEDMQWISTSIPTWSAAVALLAGSSLLDLGCSDPTHGWTTGGLYGDHLDPWLPSGKQPHNYGTSPCFMGKLTN